jgi:hypothetical protein
MEISSNELVSEAKSRMLSILGLEGGPEGWRLVKTNWAEELMGGVERENVTLHKCGVSTGDLMVRNPRRFSWLRLLCFSMFHLRAWTRAMRNIPSQQFIILRESRIFYQVIERGPFVSPTHMLVKVWEHRPDAREWAYREEAQLCSDDAQVLNRMMGLTYCGEVPVFLPVHLPTCQKLGILIRVLLLLLLSVWSWLSMVPLRSVLNAVCSLYFQSRCMLTRREACRT